VYNDKDGSGDFTRVALLAYYRFDDGGATIEDFARKAKSGLVGSTREEFAFGDQGYALPTNGLQWVDGAPVLGVDETGADDSDHDGLPDGWELVYRLDPYDDGAGEASAEGLKDGPYGPLGDPDRDGLRNLYEYWAEVNPQAENSDGDEFPDTQEDLDGDGVVNLTEQELGSRPDAIDTDDDGSPDNVEQGNGTSPADPLDPFVSRAVHLDGAAADYLEVPVQLRQALTDWTIEAWVKPDTAAGGAGTVLRRVVQTPAGSSGSALNYLLGVETNGAGLRMVAGYIRTDGTQFLLRGGSLATGVWTHLAAAYNSQTATLALYTNGTTLATTNKFYLAPPLNGKGPQVFVRIGEDFQGSLDEVRLWNRARTLAEIAQNYEQVVSGTDTNGLVHHFRFDDGQATTNEFPWSAFHQPQGLQDFVFQQDWNDQWRHAARIRGSVQITEPGAFVPPPSLRVYLQPDAARVAGAAWSLDGGGWQASGDLLENLDPGPHTLQFKTITGWGEPPGETVTLLDGVVTTLTREYTPGATLTVNLEPAEARAAGARWRVDGGEWMLSGAPVSNLSASTHTVDFLSPAGWLAPPVESVTLLPSESLTLTRTFQPILGGVTVFLLPDQAIADGAQWNVDGGGWQPSGGSVTNLTLTSHTVQFRALASWLTPAAQSFSLSNATHVVLTGAYRQVTGVLVDLAPPEAVTNGARWQLNNGPMTNSGVFQEVVAGVHTVRFASVTGWVQPADATVTVVDQLTTRLTGTYYQYEVFGGPGTNVGQFINPRGLALDASRRLYVADSGNHRIQRLDPRTGTWTAFGQFGTGAAGQLRLPHGLDLGSDGLVYVADAGNNRVQRFDPATLAWAVWGGYGTGLGQFNSPLDVAVDSAQNLYVADMMNDRVQRRTPAGVWSVFIASGTGNGLVHDPRGLAFDVAGRLYVADDGTETNGQSRIQTFAADGAYLARIGSRNAAEGGLRRPAGLDFDLATNLYAAEISLGRALAYKPAAATWSALTATNMLGGPEDVAWDPRGKLFVADTDHHRILLVNLTPEAAIITPPSVGVAFAGLPPVVTLSWLGQFGWLYTAQFAPNMAGAWNNLADAVNLLGTNGTMSCQDAGAVSTTSRYYRVLMY
jgi:sugar lactone lactonase YvrE